MKAFVASGVLLLLGVVAWNGHRALDLPAQDVETHQVVEILPETSFKAVAGLLREKGLITSPFWFRMLGKVQDVERKIQPGEYDLHTRMRASEILDVLVKGRVIQYTVVVPEGLTAHEIGMVLHAAGLADATAISQLAMDPGFAKSCGIDAPSLEGYLFPDTYNIPKRVKPEDILKTMVGRFQQVVTPELQARGAKLNMTEREIITLASIIEKETGQGDERPLVAAVFHNRLKKHFPLQSDPTVIYDITDFDGNLTRAHLTNPTPSNTYAHRGLPPGPIANPGLKSIVAALNPAPVPYLYFVSKNDGTHQFSSTLEEHNRAVARYQKRGSRHNGLR